MNREFLELYNRELRILRENAKEFAEEFPGVAERLGGLLDNNMDPMIAGLLEGTAFLASRVQLKVQHEYEEFTNNLLDQLVPDYLAPTPSAALLRIDPVYSEQALKDGVMVPAGSYAEARFVERERRIACKYRLACDTMLWPFELTQADFLASSAALQGLGVEATPHTQSGLRISLLRRTMSDRKAEPADKIVAQKSECWISSCSTDVLPFHIIAGESDAVRLYEKLFGHASGVYVRYLNDFGDPVVIPLPTSSLQQAGFGEEASLFPEQKRLFSGFDLLREYFILPNKFLGFKLTGLQTVLSRVDTNKMDIIIAFDQGDMRLQSVVKADVFAMYAAPAINLFEMTTARVMVNSNENEYHIVTDRSRHLDFEAHRLLKVNAHLAGSSEKLDVHPLYAAPPLGVSETDTVYYTVRRLPRRRSQDEKRFGQQSRYVGSDMFITMTNHRTVTTG